MALLALVVLLDPWGLLALLDPQDRQDRQVGRDPQALAVLLGSLALLAQAGRQVRRDRVALWGRLGWQALQDLPDPLALPAL